MPFSISAAAVSSSTSSGSTTTCVGRHRAHAHVGAGRRARVGDAVAGQEMRDAVADVEDDAGRLHAERRRRLDHPVETRPHVDVDVVDADRRLPDPHLAGAGPPRRRAAGSAGPRARRRRWPRPPASARRSAGAAPRGPPRSARRRALASQIGAEPLEAALVDAGADHVGQLALPARRRVEGRLPVPEGALAVGHPPELHGGHVPPERHGRVEDAVGGDVVAVGERQQLLADAVAVPQGEPPDAADLVRPLAALDLRLGHDRVPRGVAVEVAEHGPHPLDRRVDDGGPRDADHRRSGAGGHAWSAVQRRRSDST